MKQLLLVCTLLLMGSTTLLAQTDTTRADSTAPPIRRKPKEPVDWRPSGLRVGVELAGPSQMIFQPTVRQFEAAADLQVHKYLAVVEVGQASFLYQPTEGNFIYSSAGSYFRLGADINLIKPDPKFNGIFVGVRHGRNSYVDRLFVFLPDERDGYGEQVLNLENPAMRDRWWEVVASTKIQVWNGLFLGYSARYRFGYKNLADLQGQRPYAAPGIGRINGLNWRMSYYLQWRLPLSKTKKPKEEG